jgi:hypothetical protein
MAALAPALAAALLAALTLGLPVAGPPLLTTARPAPRVPAFTMWHCILPC